MPKDSKKDVRIKPHRKSVSAPKTASKRIQTFEGWKRSTQPSKTSSTKKKKN